MKSTDASGSILLIDHYYGAQVLLVNHTRIHELV